MLFLVNREGHHVVLWRALHKRFRLLGTLVHLGFVVCALAAIAKPFVCTAPQLLHLQPDAVQVWFQWAPVVDWLSFLFEYLVGVCIQIGLVLVAYCWVRGLSFSHQHLIDFAIRRFSYVVRWALLVMLVSSVFIHVPLILKNFAAFQSLFPHEASVIDARWKMARILITAVLLLFRQHPNHPHLSQRNASKSVSGSCPFLARPLVDLWLVLILAGLHFYVTLVVLNLVQQGFGDGTAVGIVWGLISPWLTGFVAAWLLASWVCYCKHGDAAHCLTGRWQAGTGCFEYAPEIPTADPPTGFSIVEPTGHPSARVARCFRRLLRWQQRAEISTAFEAGRLHIVRGPLHGGKSALFRYAGLLDAPAQGEVLVQGRGTRDLAEQARTDLRAQRLGFARAPFLLASFSVIEGVAMRSSKSQVGQRKPANGPRPCSSLSAWALCPRRARGRHAAGCAISRRGRAGAVLSESCSWWKARIPAFSRCGTGRVLLALLRQAAASFGPAVIATASPELHTPDRVLDICDGAIACDSEAAPEASE